MEVNSFESLYAPYAKLAQANAQVLQRLPGAMVFPVAWSSVRDSLSDSEPAQPQDVSANAYASLVLEMMNNWMRFYSELGQGMLAWVAHAQEATMDPTRRKATEAIKSAHGHGAARHTRSAS